MHAVAYTILTDMAGVVTRRITNLEEANDFFKNFNDQANTEYSLDNMVRLMDYLGNPQNEFKILHIAGTSGKGSTAYYAAALLTAAGQNTGLTVSPHVDKVNERLQLNGQPLPEAEFCRALTEFSELLNDAPVRPSSFELKVAFAFWYYAKEKVDYAVIETGLGGLKDATNVIGRSDKVCIITDIGLDHVKVLGDNLTEIAAQKAGIIHEGNAVFMHRQPAEVMSVFEAASENNGAKLYVAPAGNDIGDSDLPDYQRRNWSLAYEAYKFVAERDGLKLLSAEDMNKTRHISIPGRMDVRQIGNKTIVMDGAHNVQKMQAFADSFSKLYPGVKPAILLAMRTGKEYQDIVPILAPLASRIITTTFVSSQDLPIHCIPAEELAAAFKDVVPVKSIADQRAAYRELLSSPEDVGVLTGSIYMLGQIRNNEGLA
jgi:dihydrofolate synthase/folylpolyglutamate synthase